MTVEWRVFAGASAAFAATAALYWVVTGEHAGTVLLGASVPTLGLVAAYLAVQARRHGPRPEDRDDAGPGDGDPDVGYFPSSSVWPFVGAVGAVVVGNGLVFGAGVAAAGVLLLAAAVAGYAAEADAKA